MDNKNVKTVLSLNRIYLEVYYIFYANTIFLDSVQRKMYNKFSIINFYCVNTFSVMYYRFWMFSCLYISYYIHTYSIYYSVYHAIWSHESNNIKSEFN